MNHTPTLNNNKRIGIRFWNSVVNYWLALARRTALPCFHRWNYSVSESTKPTKNHAPFGGSLTRSPALKWNHIAANRNKRKTTNKNLVFFLSFFLVFLARRHYSNKTRENDIRLWLFFSPPSLNIFFPFPTRVRQRGYRLHLSKSRRVNRPHF